MPVTCPCQNTSFLMHWAWTLFPPRGALVATATNVYWGAINSDGSLTVQTGFPADTATQFSVAVQPDGVGTWTIYYIDGICYSSGFMGFGAHYNACIGSVVTVTPPAAPTTKRPSMSMAYPSTPDEAAADILLASGTNTSTYAYVDTSGVLNIVASAAYSTGDTVVLGWIQSDGTLVHQSGTVASDGSWSTS